jgi:hypothetical protein
VSDLLAKAVVAAVSAILGFFGKDLYQRFQKRREQKEELRAQLEKLQDLLAESLSVFRSQNYLARRLTGLVERNHYEAIAGKKGFDDKLCAAFDVMNAEELEMRALIRSMSMTSMHKLNSELDTWVDQNRRIVRQIINENMRLQLIDDLAALKLHLNIWFAKFDTIPKDEKRALVYLADEKKQGTEFPKRLSQTVAKILPQART